MYKKIAIVTRILPEWRVEMFRSIAQEFKKNGIEILFFYDPTAKVDGEHLSSGIHDGVPTVSLRIKKIWKFECLIGLERNLKAFKPDCVIFEGSLKFFNNLTYLIRNKLLLKRPTLWGWSSGYFTKHSKIINIFRKILFSSYKGMFLYHSTAEKIMRTKVKYGGKIVIIGNSPGDEKILQEIAKYTNKDKKRIRSDVFECFHNELLVLFVGKLTESKRVEILLHAAEILVNENFKFVIVGNGPKYDELIRAKEELNLNNVRFLGRITENVNILYSSCDIFVLPGTGGMALIQALYNRCPVISSYADGIGLDAVDDGYNGYITEVITAEYIVEKLRLMKDGKDLPRMKDNSLEIGQKFRTENIALKMVHEFI